jgi:hypothetical protein
LPETYHWLLVPEQRKPEEPVVWQPVKLSGSDALAVRASKKLRSDEMLVLSLGSTILRKHLDDVPLWRGDHVPVKQLVEDFARYLYLPRLAGPEVLLKAINDGIGVLTWRSDTFAYAEGYDDVAARYKGLRSGQITQISADSSGVLVRPEVAQRQLVAEVAPAPATVAGTTSIADAGGSSNVKPPSPAPTPGPVLRRFHGTVVLDPARVGRDASEIASEVISHLAGQDGAKVTVTLEIEVKLNSGASEQLRRIVTENSRTLKFTTHGFESE